MVRLRNISSLVMALVLVCGPVIFSAREVLAHNFLTSVFLILDNGSPITTTQDLRFSLWSDGRLDTGDIDGGGAINVAATHYAGYQTVLTLTPDSFGRLKISFYSLPSFPSIDEDNQFMMIEYKEDADPDTSYVIYDETYLGNSMNRFPLLIDGPEIFQELYTNRATTSDSFTLDRDDNATDVILQFGKTLNETLKWNDAQNYFEFSDAVVVGGNLNVNGTISRLDADNAGAGANVDIVAEQGSDADGTLRYNATLNRWEISNDGGAFAAISTGVGGADDFESVYATDADKTLITSNGVLTFNTGTNDFVVDSNDWNVTATGDLDAATITSNGALTASGITNLNGVANIGDGGDDVAINSNDWDVSSSGVGSGFTGFTSTGFVNLAGTSGFRIREVADEAAATCTTVKEVVLDTTENKLYICTVIGAPGTWVGAAAGDASSLDTLDSTQFLRSDTSDNFSTGTLTFDGGTTLTINGTANIGDGGDDVSINSNDWDISSAGVASGFTGLSSTGSVNLSGAGALRLREDSDPSANAACATVNEVIVNTTLNRLEICTATGIAGAATWVTASGGDASTLDGLDSAEFLRSNASDAFTSGTLTTDNGTTLAVNGTANIGDGGDDVSINSNDWDISSAGVASGFTGLTSTGTVNLSGASSLRLREVADETAAACTTVNEIVMDTTEDALYICTATGTPGTWAAVTPTDLPAAQARRTGSFALGGAFADVTFDATDLENNTAVVEHDNTNTDRITVKETGIYQITYDFSVSLAATVVSASAASARVRINDTTVLNGSEGTISIPINLGTVEQELTQSFILSLTANDFLSVQLTSTGNAPTVNANGIFTVTKMEGVKGDPGAGAGDAATLDSLDSTQFLRSDTSDSFSSGTLTFDAGTTLTTNGTLTVNGATTIGDNGDTVAINSSDWDISATGDMTGIGAITADGLITGTAGASVSGGILNFNASSNFAVNIATGTSTGAVSIGGGSNSVAINSTSWDVSAAGAASGFTTIDASGNVTTSAGSFCVGSTCLNETNAAGDNGATLVGAFDEFTNSNGTNVQDVLDDLDALIGSNAPNTEVLVFHPEYPDTVLFQDGTNNNGTLESLYDDTNDEQHYRWSSNQGTTQDMTLKFRFVLPADFVSVGDFSFRFRTGTVTEADNDVEVRIFNATDETTGDPTACAADTTNTSANAWTTATITAASITTGCTGGTSLNAGDIVEIQIQLFDNSGAADFADIGFLILDYTN